MAPKRTRILSPRAAAAAIALLACVGLTAPGPSFAQDRAQDAPAIETVELPSPGSPLVAVRLMFRAGSIHDPKGRRAWPP